MNNLEGKAVKLTQFQRAMDELGVVIISARSPQAYVTHLKYTITTYSFIECKRAL
jgi:glutamyl-tRNA reductase